MAKKIQDGERAAGKPDFQGFVLEGKASESVTCNAVEWIYSCGGGTIIDPDKNVTINNPNAIKALETAKSWVVTPTYSEKSHGLRMRRTFSPTPLPVLRRSPAHIIIRFQAVCLKTLIKVLSGKESAKDAVSQIERVAKRIVPQNVLKPKTE